MSYSVKIFRSKEKNHVTLYIHCCINCSSKIFIWPNTRNCFAFIQHCFLESQLYSCLRGLKDFDIPENNSKPDYFITSLRDLVDFKLCTYTELQGASKSCFALSITNKIAFNGIV